MPPRTLAEGAAMFRRGGERASEGFTETILAYALNSLGRNDDAWLARTQAFAALSAEGDSERLATSIATAAYAELGAGHRDAALSLSAVQASIARDGDHPQFAINPLVNRALLLSMSGDAAGALQTAREADALANAVTDPELRAAWSAKIAVATGAALAESNPRAASQPLTRAIDFYTGRGIQGALLDPLLLRSRCLARTGDASSAMHDLERAMTIVESHPAGVRAPPPGGAFSTRSTPYSPTRSASASIAATRRAPSRSPSGRTARRPPLPSCSIASPAAARPCWRSSRCPTSW